ncbi:hypothetical protein COO60DRAFT_1474597 [Scenedesmus sp. NREL 46B-D3]|nr:hypothetical protein COO60DRAFT_1474597 [Scenedesmus sp. NREL 46B-D3]
MNVSFSKSYAAACRHGCGKSQPCVPLVYAAPRPEQVVGRPQQLLKQTIMQVASAEVADTRGGVSLENSSILPVQGRIHSIESFSTVDGPGVRFIVFTQGCGMHCLFCSNPDTQNMTGGDVVSSKNIAAKLQRMQPYLQPNGGGVTCSGGEPLLQPDFVAGVFQEAHALGLTTCLDTTGQGSKHMSWDHVLPHTDTVLFCIKHLDPLQYEHITGVHQSGSLAFAAELKERGIPFWLRYVLIPNLTDRPGDIEMLTHFAKAQPTMLGIELLPYHVLGKSKWDALGMPYPLEGVKPPPRESVLRVVHQLKEAGLNVLCDVKDDPAVSSR